MVMQMTVARRRINLQLVHTASQNVLFCLQLLSLWSQYVALGSQFINMHIPGEECFYFCRSREQTSI